MSEQNAISLLCGLISDVIIASAFGIKIAEFKKLASKETNPCQAFLHRAKAYALKLQVIKIYRH